MIHAAGDAHRLLVELLVGPLRALIQAARVLQHRALLLKRLVLAGLNAGLLNFSILELKQFLLLQTAVFACLQLVQLLPGPSGSETSREVARGAVP